MKTVVRSFLVVESGVGELEHSPGQWLGSSGWLCDSQNRCGAAVTAQGGLRAAISMFIPA